MDVELVVYVDGVKFRGGARAKVPELLVKTFEPIDHVDDDLRFLGINALCDAQVRVVAKMREHAAQILAEHLAKLITQEMGAKDTRNGYPITPPTASEGEGDTVVEPEGVE